MLIAPSPVSTSGQLGPILRSLRKGRGLSQARLGQLVGLSQERISAIERKPETISVDQLLSVLMALNAEMVVQPKTALTKPSAEWGSW
jgi:HTH-type transcriptional regulator/antitoxin HipB